MRIIDNRQIEMHKDGSNSRLTHSATIKRTHIHSSVRTFTSNILYIKYDIKSASSIFRNDNPRAKEKPEGGEKTQHNQTKPNQQTYK